MSELHLDTVTADQQIFIVALRRALDELLFEVEKDGRLSDDAIARLRSFCHSTDVELNKILTCPCGHVSADHDEHGCTYIACRAICGT